MPGTYPAHAASKLCEANININYACCGVELGTNAPLAILGVAEVGRAATILDPPLPRLREHNPGNTMTEQSGFYCDAKALNKIERERYNQLTRKLERARLETKELPDGYALRLQSETVSLAELAEWIGFESKCCPFFGFEIELQPNGGSLWLKLRGAEGIKPFIRAEFGVQ